MSTYSESESELLLWSLSCLSESVCLLFTSKLLVYNQLVVNSDNWDSTVATNTPVTGPLCSGLSHEQFACKFAQTTTLSVVVRFTAGATHNLGLIRVNWLSAFEATNHDLVLRMLMRLWLDGSMVLMLVMAVIVMLVQIVWGLLRRLLVHRRIEHWLRSLHLVHDGRLVL